MAPEKAQRLGFTIATLANGLLGSLVFACAFSVALTLVLPGGLEQRFAIGYLALVPAWIAAMCVLFLSDRPGRSALRLALAVLVLAAVAYAAHALR